MIAQPLKTDNKIPSTTPFGTDVESEAEKYITPSTTLKPYQRIELYHQQYWWRLLRCLQENFPTLARLHGITIFNQKIGIPYLYENPPTHWALCRLGQTLPDWLAKNAFSDLDRDVAGIDAAAQRVFWIGEEEPVDFASFSEEDILTKTLNLQPHVHLFNLGGDLFTFRDGVLREEPDFWQENPFPEVRQGRCYFALYRNLKNQVKWKELSIGEYCFLVCFSQGMSIQEACEKIQDEEDAVLKEAQELMPLWFREWTFLKWFKLCGG